MTSDPFDVPLALADDASDALPSGTTLCHGQYEIIDYLNSGGFGITYLALDSLGRKVVIKECFPEAMCRRTGQSVAFRSRSYHTEFINVVELFEKEAHALAQLQHPNIVGVHQIFKDNGTAYMALDYINGVDLLQVLEDAPEQLTPETLRHILTALLKALSYVHSNGILHRDISPDNILLADNFTPVLIDFGAARENASRASRILSRVHTVKDGYSPQEFYLAGSAQERASDLYSLAATMHHLLTGSPPPNSNIRLAAVAEGRLDPYEPLRGRVMGYDDHFLDAIDQCLAVFARDRMKSAEVWFDHIDAAKRKQIQLEAALSEAEITEKIARLVAESALYPAAQPERRRVASAPVLTLETRPQIDEKERAYWAVLNDYSSDDATARAPEPRSEPPREVHREVLHEVHREAPVDTPELEAERRGSFLWRLFRPRRTRRQTHVTYSTEQLRG